MKLRVRSMSNGNQESGDRCSWQKRHDQIALWRMKEQSYLSSKQTVEDNGWLQLKHQQLWEWEKLETLEWPCGTLAYVVVHDKGVLLVLGRPYCCFEILLFFFSFAIKGSGFDFQQANKVLTDQQDTLFNARKQKSAGLKDAFMAYTMLRHMRIRDLRRTVCATPWVLFLFQIRSSPWSLWILGPDLPHSP